MPRWGRGKVPRRRCSRQPERWGSRRTGCRIRCGASLLSPHPLRKRPLLRCRLSPGMTTAQCVGRRRRAASVFAQACIVRGRGQALSPLPRGGWPWGRSCWCCSISFLMRFLFSAAKVAIFSDMGNILAVLSTDVCRLAWHIEKKPYLCTTKTPRPFDAARRRHSLAEIILKRRDKYV